MASNAEQQFVKLVGLVDQLVAIHGKLQQGPGRRHEQDAIHRAGVVMIVAAWESYVEKVVMEALQALEDAAKVEAAEADVPVPAWARHTFALRHAEIARSVQRFNTPNATNTRDLFASCLEFSPWSHWSWRARRRQWNENEMRSRLDAWVLIRHSVAHGFPLPSDIEWIQGASGQPRLSLSLLRECRKFFTRVVNQTDQAFGKHLHSHHGITVPW